MEDQDLTAHAERERLPLGDAIGSIFDEARMILPGTQTLFGFQPIVVFNSRSASKYLLLAAIGLVAVTTGLLVAPAADRRRVEPAASKEAQGAAPRCADGAPTLIASGTPTAVNG